MSFQRPFAQLTSIVTVQAGIYGMAGGNSARLPVVEDGTL